MKIKIVITTLVIVLLALTIYRSEFTVFNQISKSDISLQRPLQEKAPKILAQNVNFDIEPMVIDSSVLTPIILQPIARYSTLSPELQGKLTTLPEPGPKTKRIGKKHDQTTPKAINEYLDQKTTNKTISDTKSLVSSFNTGGQLTNIANTSSLFVPADSHGAAGPNHLVNVFNTSIEFYNKDGTGGVSTSLQTFFASLSPINFTFDPKVLYDQYQNRWVVITLQQSTGPNISNVFVAVSDDSDPNGTWYMTSINTRFSPNATDSWFDYPGFAVDEEAIYLTGNMFSFTANAGQGSFLWLIDKTDFYANLAPTVIGPLDPYALNGSSTTTQPAHVYGATPAGVGTYLVSYSRLSNGTEEFWQTVRVDNPLGAISFVQQFILIGDIEPNGGGLPPAPQAGTSSFTVNTNDPRALDAVWRDGMLYTTSTIESQS